MHVRPAKDLLITAIETNDHHGVGILLQRFFPDSKDFVCLRTTSLYQGNEPFGSDHHELCSRTLTLAETEQHLARILELYDVRRILCVPYYREEFIHAVLAKKLTGAPLCTYLMDDQNVFAEHVPDHWVAELLKNSDLCLGISPEMCAVYERKYGQKIHLLPPVLTQTEPVIPCYWDREAGEPLRAAMIGNIWTANRLEQLRGLLRATGIRIDWYGNGPKASWLSGTAEQWEQDNLFCMGFLPEDDLVASLASYAFLIVPSGTLAADDDKPAFSRLSLPSRLVFLLARTETPILVLGSNETAAGRFVTMTGAGICSSYTPDEFRRQVERLLDPTFRQDVERNIHRLAPALILRHADAWIWRSLAARRPEPADFHAVLNLEESARVVESWPIRAARPRLQIQVPAPQESFAERHGTSFAFLRRGHIATLEAHGLLPAGGDHLITHANAAALVYVLNGALPSGGDILFLGSHTPEALQLLSNAHRVWRIADLGMWQRAGYAGDPKHVVSVIDGRSYPPVFPQFDAVVSVSWCGELPADPHAQEGLSLYLEACTRPGGINLHFFTATLQPAYFWVGPAHEYLRQRLAGGATWPGLDDILATDDLFVMGQAPYDEFWAKPMGISYRAFGKPISLGLFWQKRCVLQT